MANYDAPATKISQVLNKSDPEECKLLGDLLAAVAGLPREDRRYALGIVQGMAMKAEMQTVS